MNMRNIPILILFLVCSLFPALGNAYPALERPVTDLTGVLTYDDAERIAAAILAERQHSGAQIAVLITPDTGNESIETFANGTFRQNGLGQRGTNNGVLIVLATRIHKSRIEVGEGLSQSLTDYNANTILENARGELREAHFGPAAYQIVNGVIATIGGRPGSRPRDDSAIIFWIILAVVIGVAIVLWFLMRSGGSRRRYGGSYYTGDTYFFSSGGSSRHSYNDDSPSYGGGTSDGGGASSDW